MRWVPLCVWLFVVAAESAAAQSLPGQPAGGPPPPFATAAGPADPAAARARIRGQVARADSGAPLAGAEVTLSGALMRRVTADEAGRYEFTDLPAGSFFLSAGKPGFVTLQYGGVAPTGLTASFDSGRTLLVAEGQTFDDVDFSLPRGGVITGRVTDEFGEPVTGIQIRVERYVWGPTGRQRSTFSSGFFVNPFAMATNDLGEYRLFGLAPGEYVVSARLTTSALAPGPVRFRDESAAFLPTYFPGTAAPAEAQTIRVRAGQDAAASFSMVPGRLVRVSGVATKASGAPAAGLNVFLATVTANSSGQANGGPIGADGSFTIGSVPPGDYVLRVRVQGLGAPGDEVASMPLEVGNDDITGLRITTRPGTNIKGRVEWEGSAPRPTARLRISPSAAQTGPGPLGGESPLTYLDTESGTVAEDGTFEIGGIVGKVLLRALGPLGGWSIKAVMADGVDIIDTGADAATLGGDTIVRVIMSDKTTELTGSVRDGRGQPASDYVVVLLPQQPAEGVAAMRYTRRARPDQSGAFTLRGLPPGRYVAAAVENLDVTGEWDPAVQAGIRARGERFTLAEGQAMTIALELNR